MYRRTAVGVEAEAYPASNLGANELSVGLQPVPLHFFESFQFEAKNSQSRSLNSGQPFSAPSFSLVGLDNILN